MPSLPLCCYTPARLLFSSEQTRCTKCTAYGMAYYGPTVQGRCRCRYQIRVRTSSHSVWGRALPAALVRCEFTHGVTCTGECLDLPPCCHTLILPVLAKPGSWTGDSSGPPTSSNTDCITSITAGPTTTLSGQLNFRLPALVSSMQQQQGCGSPELTPFPLFSFSFFSLFLGF